MSERCALEHIFESEKLKVRRQMAKVLKQHNDQSPEVQEMSKFLQGLVDIAAKLSPLRRRNFRLEVVQLLARYERDEYLDV